MVRCFLVLSSAVVSLASVDGISPSLHPHSDDRFFSDDYPQDTMPAFAGHKFGHPYPSLQDNDEYDRDYVQDENSDKGEWTSQMQYDILKNRLAKERAELNAAEAKLAKEKAEYEKLVGAEKVAEETAEEAERRAEAAAGESAEEDKYQPPSAQKVDQAAGEVQSEVSELKECEDELAAAQKRLKELLAQLDEAEQAAAQAAANADEKEDAAEAAEKAENVAETELAEAKKKYEAVLAELNKALEELAKFQAKLDKAAKRLHEIRFKQAGQKGGVYAVEEGGGLTNLHADGKSSTAPLGASLFLALIALLYEP